MSSAKCCSFRLGLNVLMLPLATSCLQPPRFMLQFSFMIANCMRHFCHSAGHISFPSAENQYHIIFCPGLMKSIDVTLKFLFWCIHNGHVSINIIGNVHHIDGWGCCHSMAILLHWIAQHLQPIYSIIMIQAFYYIYIYIHEYQHLYIVDRIYVYMIKCLLQHHSCKSDYKHPNRLQMI